MARKTPVSYTMITELIGKVKREAERLDISASKLVENIILQYFKK
uniref:Uncharacterized protein n=1 Tax=viral metagenome TaxID=1070528 RepID=A0A6M3MGA4_9ZZZZ